MISLEVPAWNIILRTVFVYLAVLVALRIAGKREMGQMTVFDLVVLLLLANAVQNAMVGPDTSLTGGIIAAAVLVAMNALLAKLRLHSPRLRRLVEGSPTLLVLHGEIIQKHLQHEGIDQESLEAALREHGVSKVSDVEMAVLEIDGSVSVVQMGAKLSRIKHSYPLRKG